MLYIADVCLIVSVMKPNIILRMEAVVALVAHAFSVGAADWPCFRGVDASGTANDANPPLTWSDDDNVAWKTALPGDCCFLSDKNIQFLVCQNYVR